MAVQNLLPNGIELGGGHARCDVSAHGITRPGYDGSHALQPFNVPLVIDRHRLLSRLRTVSSCTASPGRPATGEAIPGPPARPLTEPLRSWPTNCRHCPANYFPCDYDFCHHGQTLVV